MTTRIACTLCGWTAWTPLAVVPDAVWRLLWDAFVLLVLVAGAIYVWEGLDRLRDVAAVTLTPTTAVREFPNDADRVEVRGRVEAGEETLVDPVTADRVVAYEYEVTREERHADDALDWTRLGYDHLDGGEVAVPFYVDDGTGRVRVEPGSPDHDDSPVTLYAPGRSSLHYTDGSLDDAGGETAAALRAFHDRTAVEAPSSDRNRVYETATVAPGDTVYVLGDPGHDGGEPVVRGRSDTRSVVAGASQLRTVASSSGRGLLKVVVGVALVVVCSLWLWGEVAAVVTGLPGPPSIV